MEALLGFYFEVTSGTAVPTLRDLNDWVAAAGLVPRRPITLRRAPGAKLVLAVKPGVR